MFQIHAFWVHGSGRHSGKSAERVLEDRCRTVVSAVSGSTNLGPVPWAASLSSDFSCVEVATHIYPVVVVKVV